ncbi:MAG: GNAT family N-acetyltransferase [Calditrichales bacterium]|nr:GNAT family N-acetyltransferase [Calditrichales bacterium]
MEKYPKTVKLKNNKEVIIRHFKEEDTDMLINFFQALPLKQRMYLRIDVMKKQNILRRYGNIDHDRMYPVIALDNNKIIAEGTIFRFEFGWKRKLGEIRVVVAEDYQRLGLGSILTRELFLYAVTTDLVKVQAEVMDTQEAALAAFKRIGFKEEAVLKKHVTDRNDNRRDLIIMTLDIEDMWRVMDDFVQDRFYVT